MCTALGGSANYADPHSHCAARLRARTRIQCRRCFVPPTTIAALPRVTRARRRGFAHGHPTPTGFESNRCAVASDVSVATRQRAQWSVRGVVSADRPEHVVHGYKKIRRRQKGEALPRGCFRRDHEQRENRARFNPDFHAATGTRSRRLEKRQGVFSSTRRERAPRSRRKHPRGRAVSVHRAAPTRRGQCARRRRRRVRRRKCARRRARRPVARG